MSPGSRPRRFASDLGLLYLLPILVALLPWRAGFALLRRLARSERLLAPYVAAAWTAARDAGVATDAVAFARACRLVFLVERCDAFLCPLHGERWWLRRIDVDGDLATLAPGLLLTSHWGSGGWLWRVLAARGIAGHFVARRAEVTDVGRSRLVRGYLAWRTRAAMRSGCRGVIYTGGSAARIREVLAAGEAVVGMLDLPARADRGSVDVDFLGAPARLPDGLVSLAAAAGVPVTLIACGLDVETGRRRLYLERLPAGLAVPESVQRYATWLEQRIREAPGFWQPWSRLPAFRAGSPEEAQPRQ